MERLKAALQDCDAVVIGAGAGLSTAAGFTYTGERFEKYFSDFAAKYGIQDMYSGGFFPFATPEEHWAYWSRYIFINRYQDAPKPVYNDLLKLVQDKDYFVITTNVDHCFQKADFDKKRLFYTQGDYRADFEMPVSFDNSSRFKPLSLRNSQRRSCMVVALSIGRSLLPVGCFPAVNRIIPYFPQSWKFPFFAQKSDFVDIRHREQKWAIIQVSSSMDYSSRMTGLYGICAPAM